MHTARTWYRPANRFSPAIALLTLLAAGCENTGPPAPEKQTPAAPSSTWADSNQNFATSVAAEKAPAEVADLRARAVDAAATPAQRGAALRELGQQKDFESIPTVIAALDDSVPQVRSEAYEAAKKIVGGGIRLRSYDSAERRRPAIEAYQRLYALAKENSVRYFIDLVPTLLLRMDHEDETIRRHAGEDIVRLMDASFDFRADAPREQRLRVIAEFRREWDTWNAPGSELVEMRRDPEKLQAHKQKLIEEIRAKEARGVPWTTDTKARDAAAEQPGAVGK